MVRINISKYIKNTYIYLKKSNRCILGRIGQRPSEICPKPKEKDLQKKLEEACKAIHSGILLKLNRSTPRLFLTFIFAQRCKIHYIQFGKIFDICHILYVKLYTKARNNSGIPPFNFNNISEWISFHASSNSFHKSFSFDFVHIFWRPRSNSSQNTLIRFFKYIYIFLTYFEIFIHTIRVKYQFRLRVLL